MQASYQEIFCVSAQQVAHEIPRKLYKNEYTVIEFHLCIT